MPEDTERVYQIGLARLYEESIFEESLFEALNVAWVPGTSVTRYRRVWHIANMHLQTSEYVTGEIGFVTDEGVASLFFDRARGEFVSEPVMPPTTSNLDTTCPPRVPGATKICLRGA